MEDSGSLSYVGQISVIAQLDRGSSLVDDQLAGDTTLLLDDATDFDENGGQFTLNGATYTYDVADMDADSIHVVSALAADAAAGDVLTVYPRIVDRLATVVVPGFDDPIVATVPFSIAAQLPEGTRTPEIAETVLIERTAAQWIVADVLNDPSINGDFIDPDTIPVPSGIAPDGLPPAVSPNPTLIGGIGFIIAKWPGITNHDFVRYEVHVSTVLGFSPDATNKVGETVGTQFTIKQLADGVPLEYGPEDNPTQYFVRILAYDVDGYAPPSVEVAGTMVRVTGPDIAANSIYANNIVAGTITGDLFSATLLLASILKTADNGARVEMDSAGLRLYAADGGTILVNFPTDGSPVIFGEQVSTSALHVYRQADFDGSVDFNRASVATLLGGQQQPPASALSAIPTWPTPFDLPSSIFLGSVEVELAQYDAFFYDPTGYGSQPTFLCLAYAANDDQTLYLFEISAATGETLRTMPPFGGAGKMLTSIDDIVSYSTPTFSQHSYWDIGVARAGDFVYVLAAAGYGSGNISAYSFVQSDLSWTGVASNPTGDIPSGGSATWMGCTDNADPASAIPTIVYKNSTGNGVVKLYTEADSSLGSANETILLRAKTYPGLAVPWGVVWDGPGSNIYLAWGSAAAGAQASAATNQYEAASGIYTGAPHDFRNGVRSVWAGIAWDGTHYYSSDGYKLFKHSPTEWQTFTKKFWYGYTWRDAALHETTASPLVSVQPENRAWIALSFSPWTADAASGWEANVYAATGTSESEPAAGSLALQLMIPYPGTSAQVEVFSSAGASDPLSNTFPSLGSGATLQTGAGFRLRGDGTLVLPSFGTNTRNPAPTEAETIYNSSLHTPEYWTGRRWQPLAVAGRALSGVWEWYTDFMEATAATQFGPLIETDASGGTSASDTVTDLNHPGVRTLSTNSNSAARAYVRTSSAAVLLGNGIIHYTTCFKVPVLSTPSERFKCFLGLRDDAGSAGLPTNGILLRYTDNNASGLNVFEYVTVSSGTDNGGVSSGITAVADKWYRLDIYINETGTLIDFYLDDAIVTETTYIPGAGLGFVAGIEKTIGTANRDLSLDYVGAQGELLVTR